MMSKGVGVSRLTASVFLVVILIILQTLAPVVRSIEANRRRLWFWFPKKGEHSLIESNNSSSSISANENMGQAVRIMKYDRAANERNAISALDFVGQELKWHRLDDGVMGGQSETVHRTDDNGVLHFDGTINTNGGGFTSLRTPFEIPQHTQALKLCFRGDGKTYKVIMSSGKQNSGSPFSHNPSWQADLPTKKLTNENEWEEATIDLSTLVPAFGGRPSSRPSEEARKKYKFDASEMKELGLMLSLQKSNGTPNPKETFGEGIFPFSLQVKSIEAVREMQKQN